VIVCTSCGHENLPSDSFCGNCGQFLEWVGQATPGPGTAETTSAAEVASTAEAASPPPTADASSSAAPPPPAAEAEGPPAPPSSPPPGAPRKPRRPQPGALSVPGAGPEPPSAGPAASERARGIPPGGPAPGAALPARQPSTSPSAGRPVTAGARSSGRPAPSAAPALAGERPCPSCGQPNDPSRRFCRRCGATLEEVVVEAPRSRPWWRRWGAGRPSAAPAGERRPARRGSTSIRPFAVLRNLLGLLLLVAAAGFLVLPPLRLTALGTASALVDQVRRMVSPTYLVVRPSQVTASDELTDHRARLAFDSYTNTDWEARGGQPTLTLAFPQPLQLGAIIVHAGSADHFADLRRPTRIELAFPDGATVSFQLSDRHDPQQFTFDAPTASTVVVRILEAAGPASAPLAVSEIEFFARQ
jgi:hypothetical protein